MYLKASTRKKNINLSGIYHWLFASVASANIKHEYLCQLEDKGNGSKTITQIQNYRILFGNVLSLGD